MWCLYMKSGSSFLLYEEQYTCSFFTSKCRTQPNFTKNYKFQHLSKVYISFANLLVLNEYLRNVVQQQALLWNELSPLNRGRTYVGCCMFYRLGVMFLTAYSKQYLEKDWTCEWRLLYAPISVDFMFHFSCFDIGLIVWLKLHFAVTFLSDYVLG